MTTFNIKRNGTCVAMTLSAIFLLFTGVYVFSYQQDTLALTQYVLSKGTTVYSPVIGGSILFIVLAMLQFTVGQFMRRKPLCIYALSCFPSFYLLAMLGDFDPSRSFSPWGWLTILMPIAAVVWWLTVCFLGEYLRYRIPDGKGSAYIIRMYAINFSLMVAMMLFVGVASNSDDIRHYRLRMERLLMHGEYAGALEVGVKSEKSDPGLTMLRVFALAHEGRLGEDLFTYPVSGTSADMVPALSDNRLAMLSPDSVYHLLGAIPRKNQTTQDFLNSIVKSGQATPAVTDYLLCGMLIDRRLDAFVSLLQKTRKIDDTLPRHYREALILYTHRRANPIVVYRNTVMDTDYEDMQKLEAQAKTPSERRLKIHDQFSGTYWEYFDYE